MSKKQYCTLLSIAGSDSIGGAGIQADIKTASALGVYAMTVITAVTAQNSSGVKSIHPIPEEMVEGQLSAVAQDIPPDAVKIGMIPDINTADTIARFLEKEVWGNIVIDPVMRASSGDELANKEIINLYRNRLFPLATLITPNLPEAELLTGVNIKSEKDIREAAESFLNEFGCRSVLIKGGHAPKDGRCNDYLFYFSNRELKKITFSHGLIESRNTHGTGCTLSSAIASALAKGFGLEEACGIGIDFLVKALEKGTEYEFGKGEGYGPLNHFVTPIIT